LFLLVKRRLQFSQPAFFYFAWFFLLMAKKSSIILSQLLAKDFGCNGRIARHHQDF